MTGSVLLAGVLRGGRAVIGAPLLFVLMLLEPVVRWVCSIALVLGLIVSVVFELSAVGTRFPFLAMVGTSLVFGVVLIAYYGLIALLTRRE